MEEEVERPEEEEEMVISETDEIDQLKEKAVLLVLKEENFPEYNQIDKSLSWVDYHNKN